MSEVTNGLDIDLKAVKEQATEVASADVTAKAEATGGFTEISADVNSKAGFSQVTPTAVADNTVATADPTQTTTTATAEVETPTQTTTGNSGLIIDLNPATGTATASPTTEATEYNGPGLVIDGPIETKTPDGIVVGPMANKDTMEGVTKTLKEMDNEIDVQKAVAAEILAKRKNLSPEEKAIETTVLIDKTGLGNVEFTEEEKKRLTVSKQIHVVEVEKKDLATVKTKKAKKEESKKIIKRHFDRAASAVIASTSGWLGKIGNMSSIEVLSLAQPYMAESGKTTAEDLLNRWSIIYDKLKFCSIGAFESFDDFLNHVSTLDYDGFLFGILCATYTDDDRLPLRCQNEKCVNDKKQRTEFEYAYSNKNLLMADKISDEHYVVNKAIMDASAILEDAKAYHETQSILNMVKRMSINEGEILVDVYCPSVHETIERLVKPIIDGDYKGKEDYNSVIQLTQYIKTLLIADPDDLDEEGNPSYFIFEDAAEIIEALHEMGDELILIAKTIENTVMKYNYVFGFKAETIECPICKQKFTQDVIISPADLLFHRAQQRLTMKVD